MGGARTAKKRIVKIAQSIRVDRRYGDPTRPGRNPISCFAVLCKKYTEIREGSTRIECLPEPLFSYCRVEFTWISAKFQGFHWGLLLRVRQHCPETGGPFRVCRKIIGGDYVRTDSFSLPSPPTLAIFLAYLYGFDRTPNRPRLI